MQQRSLIFGETSRAASKEVFRRQMRNVLNSGPAFSDCFVVAFRTFIIALAASEREANVLWDQLSPAEAAAAVDIMAASHQRVLAAGLN